ncbi:MAG: alpha/beta hydrolase, partial [Cyanobacteria bacterium P01_F01_bin.56]
MGMAMTAIALTAPSGHTAEKVVWDFGPFSRSLTVDALEAYALDGTIDDDLAYYLRRLSPDRQTDV